MRPLIPLAFALLGATSLQASETVTVTLEQATENGTGAPVGTVTISQSPYGLVFTPDLQGLEPGAHGFHVHTEANCNAAEVDGKLTPAGAAGGHWPRRTLAATVSPGKTMPISATCRRCSSPRMAAPASRCWHRD